MQKVDFKTFINGVGNDIKVAVDDFISAIITIKNDLEQVKANLSISSTPNDQD